MKRRDLLRKLAVAPLIALGSSSGAGVSKSPLKIMMKNAWGSDDPTKAAFPFLHGHALFGNPSIFVAMVEWADKIITE
jgi:hypothetical protein